MSRRQHRNVMASAFGGGTVEDEDVNFDPMSGLANMSDVMLVFACGLIVALVAYFHLNVTPAMTQVEETQNMQELTEEVQQGETTMSSGGESYEELGVVYRDSDGNLWILKENAQGGDTSSTGSGQ